MVQEILRRQAELRKQKMKRHHELPTTSESSTHKRSSEGNERRN
jgi:hypothetical protein